MPHRRRRLFHRHLWLLRFQTHSRSPMKAKEIPLRSKLKHRAISNHALLCHISRWIYLPSFCNTVRRPTRPVFLITDGCVVVDFSTPEQFREFGYFLDGLGGISAGWSSYFAERDQAPHTHPPQVSDISQTAQDIISSTRSVSEREDQSENEERPGTPVGSWIPAGPRQAKIVEDVQGSGKSFHHY
jgi:hypothetical protein